MLCKLCSSALLGLSQENLTLLFEYTLNALNVKRDTRIKQNDLTFTELQVVLKLSRTIFRNFKMEG
jgi:hypothetical protein